MALIVINRTEIPDKGAKIVEAGPRLKIAVFRMGERVAAINNRCPHAGGALGLGDFDGVLVKCPMHGFRVDVWTGMGNAGKRVETFPVVMVGDEVHLIVPDGAT